MPYLDRTRRDMLDPHTEVLAELIANAGDLNYILNKLSLALAQKNGGNYAAQNEVVGAMECAKQEYYRRVIAPYENEKVRQNGDVF